MKIIRSSKCNIKFAASKKSEVKICPFCVERLFDCKSAIAEEYRQKYPETYEEYTAKLFMKAL